MLNSLTFFPSLLGRGAHTSRLPLCGGFLSVQAISWVIDHSQHKGNTFVVLLMIANHARSDGTGAWPSVATIAKESRLSRRTVQRCVHRLSLPWSGKKNWQTTPPELAVRVGKGPYGSNLYELPGVKLTQGGRQNGQGGASDSDAGGASAVTPNPSLTVPKDKEHFISEVEQKVKTAESGARSRFLQKFAQHQQGRLQ